MCRLSTYRDKVAVEYYSEIGDIGGANSRLAEAVHAHNSVLLEHDHLSRIKGRRWQVQRRVGGKFKVGLHKQEGKYCLE